MLEALMSASNMPTSTPTNMPTIMSASNMPTATPTIMPTIMSSSNMPTSTPTNMPTTMSASNMPTSTPTNMPTTTPTSAPTEQWLHMGLVGTHFQVNATLNDALPTDLQGSSLLPDLKESVGKMSSATVGPMPSFFVFACIVGIAVTAMVTLRRKRAAAGDRWDGELKPLVAVSVQVPTAVAPTTRAKD